MKSVWKQAIPAFVLGSLMSLSSTLAAYPVPWGLESATPLPAQGRYAMVGSTTFSHYYSAASYLPGVSISLNSGYRFFSSSQPGSTSTGLLQDSLGGDAAIATWLAADTCADAAANPACGLFNPSREGLSGARLHALEATPTRFSVPEPDIVILMGLGIAGIAYTRITRKRRRTEVRPG